MLMSDDHVFIVLSHIVVQSQQKLGSNAKFVTIGQMSVRAGYESECNKPIICDNCN